jgi:hypothetical protein
MVLWAIQSAGRNIRWQFATNSRLLVDAHEAAESNGQVRYANGLHDDENDAATDVLASCVLFVRFVGVDVEVGNVAISVPQLQW